MHYVAVIDKDPDSAFGIRFPEAPGCFSAADAFEDILPSAIEALALYFEDGEKARPRGLETVSEEVAKDIAAGAFLTLVPHLPERRRSRCIEERTDLRPVPGSGPEESDRLIRRRCPASRGG